MQISITTLHDDYRSERTIHYDWIENQSIEAGKTGQGLGTKVFKQQVDAASKLGFKYITTWAARGDVGENGAKANGYYTWPRLGYDNEISDMGLSVRSALQRAFPQAKNMSDLMRTAEGRDWWMKNGEGCRLNFDLKENSLSRRVLDAYVKERASRSSS